MINTQNSSVEEIQSMKNYNQASALKRCNNLHDYVK